MRSPSEAFRHQKRQYNHRALTNLIPHSGLAQLKLFVDKYGKMSSPGQFAAPERGYRLNRLRKNVEQRAKTVPSAAKAGHNCNLTDGLKAVPFKEFSFSAACLART
jgi:hypothetical protein